jgi:hypothetical protein
VLSCQQKKKEHRQVLCRDRRPRIGSIAVLAVRPLADLQLPRVELPPPTAWEPSLSM